MKRLIEQTACEHGKWESHGFHDGKVLDLFCPGGSSREVTEPFDVEVLAFLDAVMPQHRDSEDWRRLVRDGLSAALAGGR